MATNHPTKVAIIVDKINEQSQTPCDEGGRTSYWERVERKSKPVFHYFSLSDSIAKGENPIPRIFAYNTYQIVIINWDAINGDPIYGSDSSLQLLRHYSNDIDAWVKGGGVLVMECQEGGRRLTAPAYDLFTEDSKYPVVIRNGEQHDNVVHINPSLRTHPLLSGLNEGDYKPSQAGIDSRNVIKPYPDAKSTSLLSGSDVRWGDKIFLGWFDRQKTHKEWLPLIFAKSSELGNKDPVMLCRVAHNSQESYGAYVLTTMFIPYSGWTDLIDNILNFRGVSISQAYELFHSRMKRAQKEGIAVVSSIVFGIVLVVIGIWVRTTYPDLKFYDLGFGFILTANLAFLASKRELIFRKTSEVAQRYWTGIGRLVGGLRA